jgi:hypothetical protein
MMNLMRQPNQGWHHICQCLEWHAVGIVVVVVIGKVVVDVVVVVVVIFVGMVGVNAFVGDMDWVVNPASFVGVFVCGWCPTHCHVCIC